MRQENRKNRQGIQVRTTYFPTGWKTLYDYFVSNDSSGEQIYDFTRLEKVLNWLSGRQNERRVVYVNVRIQIKDEKSKKENIEKLGMNDHVS